ncbi:MAG: hypothetical protein ACUVRX_11520 [Actinomycetota bacterium]
MLFGLAFLLFLFLAFCVGKKGPITEGHSGAGLHPPLPRLLQHRPPGMPFERMDRTSRDYPTAPVSQTWTLFGESLAGFAFRGACISVFPVLAGTALFSLAFFVVDSWIFNLLRRRS